MPRVIAKQDTLNQINADYNQVPLAAPVFLNSVPKCGSHLMKNIMRMFVPVAQQYDSAFIQIPVLEQHKQAFNPASPMLSWGHLLFADNAVIYLKHTRHILMVRDPYDWVLARARFFLSDNFQGGIDHLKNGNVAIDEMLNMMIFGVYQKIPTLAEIFENNCLAWMGTKVKLVKYEDMTKHLGALESKEAEQFFGRLLGNCGIDMPDDWRERVTLGADRKQSGTARENLSLKDGQVIPDELPEMQKRLVNVAAPGLREILGYI